jgi:integrase
MISLSDVAIDNKSTPSIIYLTLRQSETDISGSGVTLHLGKTGDALCPVAALLNYLAIHPSTQGPLFITESGNPLAREMLVAAIRRALRPTLGEVSQFNGHSFRIGAATTAAQAGVSDSLIMQLGRWKSSAFTRYLQPPVESLAAISRRLLD